MLTQLAGQLEIQNPVSGRVRFVKRVFSSLTDIEAQVDSSSLLVVGTSPVTVSLSNANIDAGSFKNVGTQPVTVTFVLDDDVTNSTIITLQPGSAIAFAGMQ